MLLYFTFPFTDFINHLHKYNKKMEKKINNILSLLKILTL